jgi:protein arginine N-methyltransferase 5
MPPNNVPVALALPFPLPPAAIAPRPTPSPLQNAIQSHIQGADYDAVVIPLTNGKWQSRWEKLCLRPMEDEEEEIKPEILEARERERENLDREADMWRKEGGLLREECNITRLEDGQRVIAAAADWLELDSPDEGIRFDSELVSDRLQVVRAFTLGHARIPGLHCPSPPAQSRHEAVALYDPHASLTAPHRPCHLLITLLHITAY